jgi:hypothetical protein
MKARTRAVRRRSGWVKSQSSLAMAGSGGRTRASSGQEPPQVVPIEVSLRNLQTRLAKDGYYHARAQAICDRHCNANPESQP